MKISTLNHLVFSCQGSRSGSEVNRSTPGQRGEKHGGSSESHIEIEG